MTPDYEKRHNAKIAALQKKIDKAFNTAVKEAAALGLTLDTDISEDAFRFQDFPKTKKQLNALLAALADDITTTVENGINAAWKLANEKNDDLVYAVGLFKDDLTDKQRKVYFARNEAARDAFRARKVAGLALSDRVWRYTNQFKEEIEMALDLELDKGTSAASLTRQVKRYLQHPDMLFRRVRDKHGMLHLSQRAAAYHPGHGVYRSSYKNALRLTATETNIAYRSADYERQQQLDFVVGIEIKLSNNHTCLGADGHPHPFEDICDDLAGRYPKTFKFTGWHPFCRCHAETVLKTSEEMADDTERILRGEEPLPAERSKNYVKDLPQGFTRWAKDNASRIDAARGRGTLPYFLKDNPDALADKPKPLTTLEKAKLRHEARTKEQIEATRKAWQKRYVVYHYGENMLNVMGGISDVDTSALAEALKHSNKTAIIEEAAKLKAIGKHITALAHLENPLQVAKNYSMADAVAVNTAVTERIKREGITDLSCMKSWLENEIKWVEDHKKYSTWKVAQDAYKKELAIVERKIAIKSVANGVDDALAYGVTTRSKSYKALADEMRTMLASSHIDVDAAKAKAAELNKEYEKLRARKLKREKTDASGKITPETIDDLKKRLGKKFPKTLPNLEDAIKKYEETSKYGSIAKAHKNEIETLMRKVFDKHDLGMNIQDDTLEYVLDSWFKNTFETGSSGGWIGSVKTTGAIETSHGRLKAAHKLFGLDSDLEKGQLSRHDYEKYGNLLDHNILSSITHNTATQYGNVEVRFKKEKVVATWTAGDSLGKRYQPSLVSDPRSCSFDNMSNAPISEHEDITNLATFKEEHINGYIELQYHGDLTIDCVDSLTFPYNLKADHRSKYLAIAKRWKAKGVKVYYVSYRELFEL